MEEYMLHFINVQNVKASVVEYSEKDQQKNQLQTRNAYINGTLLQKIDLMKNMI